MGEKQAEKQSSKLPDWLRKEVESVVAGSKLEHVEPVGEGEGEQMAILSFSSGQSALVKWNDDAPQGLFQDEYEGMRTLREASEGSVYVPEVFGFGDRWLMMEDVKEGEREDAAASFGRGLANMHKKEQERYGYDKDNYLGPLLQPNDWMDSWVAFFRERRLRPAIEWLDDSDAASSERRRKLEAVAGRLEKWLDVKDVAPSLLHGHLTGHSWMAHENGMAVLVDPALYYGHREVDLAALRLLGDPPQAFWQAYEEIWPVYDGFEERAPVYQLYYLLAHIAMGEDKGKQLDQVLEALGG